MGLGCRGFVPPSPLEPGCSSSVSLGPGTKKTEHLSPIHTHKQANTCTHTHLTRYTDATEHQWIETNMVVPLQALQSTNNTFTNMKSVNHLILF